jgi:hypothetical protein
VLHPTGTVAAAAVALLLFAGLRVVKPRFAAAFAR